jgi:hypothetical protein
MGEIGQQRPWIACPRCTRELLGCIAFSLAALGYLN